MEAITESVKQRIAEALAEDIGSGDWTSEWCVEPGVKGRGEIVAKAEGIVAGLTAAGEVYRQLGGAELLPLVGDGDEVTVGMPVARVTGEARAILTGERTALNLLGQLSGVATLTRHYVTAVDGTGARITDTRKTTPLWRELERAATRAGGAVNHRRGLDAMVLIKENHLACSGGIGQAVERVRASNAMGLEVEVETTNLQEVNAALAAGVDRIMLDNMPVEQVREAVRLIARHDPRPEVEASGGVTLANVRELAEAGVDYISVGALTHSAPALDLSLILRRVAP
ncbi:MAG: carboxylating nicotinate-nucleotide diphosphorylase [Gemmatimonadetes bacterium]|nr:carboxylating nicotinate-nucleotide diphosphorylase [Gemmatimonadota bacterium]NIO33064.1 carboxylating nicotinate-nucleotide diphosphorylase [Gemmatimonadota bacterium]